MKKSSLSLVLPLVIASFLLSSYGFKDNKSVISAQDFNPTRNQSGSFLSKATINRPSELSTQDIKDAFENFGFIFKTVEPGHIQGDYTTQKDKIRVNVVLMGLEQSPSSIQLNFLSKTATDETNEIIQLFFDVIFSNEESSQEAFDWFKMESGNKSNTQFGFKEIENQSLSYGNILGVGGFWVSVTPGEETTVNATSEFNRFQVKGCLSVIDCPDSIQIFDLFDEDTDFSSGTEFSTTTPVDNKVHFAYGWCTKSDELLSNNLEIIEIVFNIDGKSVIDETEKRYYSIPVDADHPDEEFCYGLGGIVSGWEPGVTHKIQFGHKTAKNMNDGWYEYEPFESINTYIITGEGTPEPTGSLKGHILQKSDEKPIAGLSVYLCEVDYGYCTVYPAMKTETKPDGSFEFGSLKPSEYVILFSKSKEAIMPDEISISVNQLNNQCAAILSNRQSDPKCENVYPFFRDGDVTLLKGTAFTVSPDGMIIDSGVVRSNTTGLSLIIENSEPLSATVNPDEETEIQILLPAY